MFPTHKRKAFIILIITVVAMLLLEAGISGISLGQGESFSWNIRLFDVSPGIQIHPLWQNNILLILIVIAFFSIFLTREGRKKLLILIISFAIITYLLYHYKPVLELPPTSESPQPTQTSNEEVIEEFTIYPAQPPELFEPHIPSWLITLVGVGLSLVLAISLVAVLGIAFSYRLRGTFSFSRALSEEVESAIEALEAGLDFKDAISRCYAQMSRVLQEERGLLRGEDMTPREFELMLTQKGFPAWPVQTLTRLFEQVRYGQLAPDENNIQTALFSLNAIREHCQTLKMVET